MTPKEKADELIDKMYYIGRYDEKEDYNLAMAWERAKQSALIAVEEILLSFTALSYGVVYLGQIDYWQEVKFEIDNL